MASLKDLLVTGPARIVGKVFSTGGFSGPGSELTSLNGSNIASGTVPYARLPVGTGSSQVAQGSHTHSYRANTSPTSGSWFQGTPLIGSDGVIEIGKYIDFHATNTATSDYDMRVEATNGALTLSGNLYAKFSNIDAKQTNNGVSGTQYPTTFSMLDKNGLILTRKEAVITTDGNIATYWYVRNYNTEGTSMGQKGIKMTMNKSGTLTYSIDEAENFRTAIGAVAASHNHGAGNITSGTLGLARGGTGNSIGKATSLEPRPNMDTSTYNVTSYIKKLITDGYDSGYFNSQGATEKGFPTESTSDWWIIEYHQNPAGNMVDLKARVYGSSYTTYLGFLWKNADNLPNWSAVSLSSHTHSYLPLSGGTLTGSLTIKKLTAATNTYTDANPKLIFSNTDASQNVSLTFSDYDSVQAPASLTLNGNQGGEYFIAPNIKATSNIYVGSTAVSLSGHTHSYLPLSGGTVTGATTIKNILTLYREGTTANNYAAGILFSNKDTTTGQTYSGGYLYAYQDHGSTSYGFNIVLNPGGGLFIGSGESPANHYSAKGASYTGEDTWITADGTLNMQANGNTIANRVGGQWTTGHALIPIKADVATNNVGTIGTNDYKWNAVYATTFHGALSGNATSATSATNTKYLMNRGANTVTIADSSWGLQATPSGHTNRETVFSQRWTQSGLTYTPSGGSATTLTDSADIKIWLSSSNTANILQTNIQIDGLMVAAGGFKGNVTGNCSGSSGSCTGNAATATSATTATTATNLSGFQKTTTTNIGIDTSDTNQAIGYVNSLTKAAWNYQQTDGALYKQSYSANWIHQIFGDYRTGQISIRGKNNGSWQSWRNVLDSSNFTSYVTPSAIGAAASHTHPYLSTSGGTLTGLLKLGYTNNSTQPTIGINVLDIRSVNSTPGVGDKSVNWYFHMADTPDTSKWWSIMKVRGWEGGYSAWELAGPSHATDQRTCPLYVRTSNINTAWGSWRKIYDTSNPPTCSEVGAATSSHNHEIQNLTNFSARVYDATISRTKNTVLAAPNGSNGAAGFRALAPEDLPGHSHSNTLTTASNTGSVDGNIAANNTAAATVTINVPSGYAAYPLTQQIYSNNRSWRHIGGWSVSVSGSTCTYTINVHNASTSAVSGVTVTVVAAFVKTAVS